MAKLLNLKLSYKGKLLDFVKEGGDIKKKFFIGSNKYLFWQILDPNFPEKHLLINEKGNQYYLLLPPGAKLSCMKDGAAVDSAFLTQNSILRGTELLLRPDMTGTIAIAPEWEISYEYKEPWVSVLTPEEKQIVAQYASSSEPTSLESFNRNLLLLSYSSPSSSSQCLTGCSSLNRPSIQPWKQSSQPCKKQSLFAWSNPKLKEVLLKIKAMPEQMTNKLPQKKHLLHPQ